MLDQEALFGHIYDMHEGLFYKTEHQIIFSAIRMLQNCKYDVDMLTVVEELRREGNLEAAGGAFYISQLTSNVVSAAHMEYHLQILTEKYMQREVIRTSTESIKAAYDETCDAVQLLDDAQKSLMEVSEKSFSRDSRSMDALMSNAEKTFLSDKPDGDRRDVKFQLSAFGFFDTKYDCPTNAGMLFFRQESSSLYSRGVYSIGAVRRQRPGRRYPNGT